MVSPYFFNNFPETCALKRRRKYVHERSFLIIFGFSQFLNLFQQFSGDMCKKDNFTLRVRLPGDRIDDRSFILVDSSKPRWLSEFFTETEPFETEMKPMKKDGIHT